MLLNMQMQLMTQSKLQQMIGTKDTTIQNP